MTGPGELNHRLVLEEPIESADGLGGVTRSYQAVATLWAALKPVAARGAVEAASRGANVTHHIVIRFRSFVTTRHRLREGTRIFRIVALRDRDGRRRFMKIDAEERVD